MTEINASLYKLFRDKANENITYIEIRDNLGVQVIRIPVSDSRVTYTFNRNNQTQVYTILIKGSDSDITLPKVFGGTALYDGSGVGATELAKDTFDALAYLNSVADEVTITINLSIPQVV